MNMMPNLLALQEGMATKDIVVSLDESGLGTRPGAQDTKDASELGMQVGATAALIRKCGDSKDLLEGRRVHAQIIKSGYDGDRYLGNLLVQMYGKCGSLENACRVFERIFNHNVFSWTIMIAAYAQNGHLQDARDMFNKMPQRNVVSWNVMITAYAQNGHAKKASNLFRLMDLEGVQADKFTFISLLDACASLSALSEGRIIHADIACSSFYSDVAVGTALLNMYGKSGSLQDARDIFDRMPHRNVVAWTAMIAAYAQNGYSKEALQISKAMDLEGVQPDEVTFITILDACADLMALADGKITHVKTIESGLQLRIKVCNALVNVYGKCGCLQAARNVFDKMPRRDVVSWNAMIDAYAHNGFGREALEVFRLMELEGIQPDAISFVSALGACAALAALPEGILVHAEIVGSGFDRDAGVGTALVNMYGKCGSLQHARRLLDKMPRDDVVSWNAMMAAYAQNGQRSETLMLFRLMDLEGVSPDEITLITVFDACANIAALQEGKLIHSAIARSNCQLNQKVGNSLVNMYGKCGSLREASNMFNQMLQLDVVSWTAMIAAYARNGHCGQAIEMFQRMQLEGVRPNKVTFVTICSACRHAGLLNGGRDYFVSISQDYSIAPTADLFVCMVDLLGRAGHLDEADNLIKDMPFEPDVVAWTSLLGACWIHGDVERGARAADQASSSRASRIVNTNFGIP